MLGKTAADAKCRHGVANVEAQHNILHDESLAQYETLQSESKYASDRNIVLNDYETDRTSKRIFFLIANNIPENQVGQVENTTLSEKSESSVISTPEKPESVKLDTVRSGESLIKHFNFDTSKYNSDTNKCIAFWRTLMETDLQPVKCTLLKGGRSSITAKQCDQEEEESSGMWYKALVELQRRKMDEAAFAAIPRQCKLCGQEEPYAKFKKKQDGKYSESELKDYEDLTCLNYWNPNEKQVAVNKSSNMKQPQHEIVENLPSMTEQQLELPPLITVEDKLTNEDNISTNQESITEEKCGTEDTITLSNSEPCTCGRIRCLCNKANGSSDDIMKSSNSDPCKCGRTHCLCNTCDESSQEVESVNISLSESQEKITTFDDDNDKISAKQALNEQKETDIAIEKNQLVEEADKGDTENVINENLSKGILPKCDICKTYCNCWEHKIEMSKQFIDESRYKLKRQEATQDKSCETENEIEEKVEKQKTFCIICGHNDCNCNGPQHKQSHKYFQYMEFDDNMITTLLIKKDKSLREVKSLTHAAKLSRSTFQQKIYEHSKKDVCCTVQRDEIPDGKQKEIKIINNVITGNKLQQKKILITPEQRVKDITNKNRVVLECDKYGIPQLRRYADGRLAPKPTTSQDIISSNNSDHEG